MASSVTSRCMLYRLVGGWGVEPSRYHSEVGGAIHNMYSTRGCVDVLLTVWGDMSLNIMNVLALKIGAIAM